MSAHPSVRRIDGSNVFAALLCAAPLVAAVVVLLWNYTPLPLIDDFWHVFAFAIDAKHVKAQGELLSLLLLGQVGPYKLLFVHVLVLLQEQVFGRLLFPLMIWLGNCSVPGIAGLLLWDSLERDRLTRAQPLLLAPVTLLLFSLNYAETVDWAVSGLQQPMVIFFSLLSLFFLARVGHKRFASVYACLAAVGACAVYANGMLLWPLGFLFLCLRRRWAALLAWSASAAVAAVFYLYHYRTDGLTTHAALGAKLLFFVMFCGGALENMHHRPIPFLSVAIGACVLGLFLYAMVRRLDRRAPFLALAGSWVLLTGAVVANARISLGLQLSLSSRYKIYCDLLIALTYLAFLAETPERRRSTRGVMICGLAVGLVICVAGDVAGARFLATRRSRAEAAMCAYLADPARNSPMFLVEETLNPEERAQEDLARREMNEARRLGLYEPPPVRSCPAVSERTATSATTMAAPKSARQSGRASGPYLVER